MTSPLATIAVDSGVLTDRRGAVLTVTLNRPERGNSLSSGVIARLQQIFDDTADDKSIHVVVLAASGRIFCAGHDLGELRANSTAEFPHELATVCSRMMQTMQALPQPVIAKVQGVATAAGCQLVATCDLAVASSEARFATPGVNIGTWCSTPMVALSRAIAPKHAMQLLLTGRLHDAAAALRMGLVNEVTPPQELDAAVARLADEIAGKSAYAIALGKKAFYHQLGMSLSDAYEYAGELVVRNGMAADAREGVAAFLDKRPPRWAGR